MIRLEEYHDQWIEEIQFAEDGIAYVQVSPRISEAQFRPKYIEYLKSLYPHISYLSFWIGNVNILIPIDNYASI